MSFTNFDEISDYSTLVVGQEYIYDAGALSGAYRLQFNAFKAGTGEATFTVLELLEEGISSMAFDHFSPGESIKLLQHMLGYDMAALYDPSSTAQGGMRGRILAEFGDALEQIGVDMTTL